MNAQEEEGRIIDNQLWGDYYQYCHFKPDWQFYGDVGARSSLEKLT